MNNILELKGKFYPKHRPKGWGSPNIPKGESVSAKHISNLKKELLECLKKWNNNEYFDKDILISVHYVKVLAKSNRIKSLLLNGKNKSSNCIKGSRFEYIKDEPRHVFTYFIEINDVKETIKTIDLCLDEINNKYNGSITYSDINKIKKQSTFVQTIVDCYYVDHFDIDERIIKENKPVIITIYDTNREVIDLFKEIGIEVDQDNIISRTTIRLTAKQMMVLQEKAPYLIATQMQDFTRIPRMPMEGSDDFSTIFPEPKDEYTIGIIDTHFDESISFHKWVKYENCMDKKIKIEEKDKVHATAVASIIVNGPAYNKDLDDECGMFKARVFGVSKHDGFSSFGLYKQIRKIVEENPDIKVWNMSLGSKYEIEQNFISPIAALLDDLQNEKDIIFVIAGTNIPEDIPNIKKIGSPADSLNSLVVNSVDKNKKEAPYTRKGPVLSFFHKPDVSYYGGVKGSGIAVGTPMGLTYVSGTSFAAPWIARKLAYLIHIIGLDKETAKALIIDSAIGWNTNERNIDSIGYGVVPIKISDVLSSADDEIKFILKGKAEDYQMFNYDIPVPIKNGKYNYYAKATLCYSPCCDRNQGVDYTTGEMSMKFGRMKMKDNKPFIEAIDNNIQDDDNVTLFEKDARMLYRKWDNVKNINTGIEKKQEPKTTFGQTKWGISITTKDRIQSRQNRGTNFSIIITLKEMDGDNRIRDFIEMCKMNNWIVNEIDINNKIDISNRIKEEIELD